MRFLLPLALLLLGSPAMAQTPPPVAASRPDARTPVRQPVARPGPTPRLLRLSPDGRLATLLRNRPDDRDRYDLWAIDTATGAARMLVDSQPIGTGAALSEEEKMRRERLRICRHAAASPIMTGRRTAAPSWCRSTAISISPALDGNVRRITNTPETEIDAKVSETGRYLSFLRDHNLYVIGADGSRRAAR